MRTNNLEARPGLNWGTDQTLAALFPTDRSNLPLERKTAFVTGGNRDTGAGAIRALARFGISQVGSIHRDLRKSKREEGVVDYAARYGTEVTFALGDFTTSEGIQAITTMVDGKFRGNVNILQLNSSGIGRDVNVIGANAIVDALLPRMKPGAIIMLRQSVPGHYFGELKQQGREGEIPDFYRGIAEVKFEGEQSLLARMEEFNARGIRFLIDCPPEIGDTGNIALFTRADRDFSQKHAGLLASYGLPHIIPIEAVGHTAAQMLANPNLPSGYIEMYRETRDVWEKPLSKFYTVATGYAGWVNPKYNFGIYRVPVEQTDRSSEPVSIDAIEFTPDGAVAQTRMTKAHSKDHFRDEVGFNPYPLHKQVRTAMEVAEAIVNNDSATPKIVRLSSFEGVQGRGAILPGAIMETRLNVLDRSDASITFDVETSRDGKPANAMQKVVGVIEDAPAKPESGVLLADQLIESAAQMAGTLSWDVTDEGLSPLFLSIGRSWFLTEARAKDLLTGLINPRQTRRGSDSDVLIVANGQDLAYITRITTIVARKDVIGRILGI